MSDDDDFEIIAFNGLTGECLTTDDVDPILILPTSTPDFERGIWEAVLEAPGRDWDETEKEYLRRNDGIRKTLADWAEFMKFSHCWTNANVEFIKPYLTEQI
jgi:hypothetical protein